MVSDYFVKLEQFEGPLDLLLHLIRFHEINVFDIDIVKLTTQYLEYLRLVGFQDLGIAGGFLEMASTLIEIKSRMLLPGEKNLADDEVEEELDPREELQRRLIEYEMFRLAAGHLASNPQFGVQIVTNHEWARLEPEYAKIEAPLRGDPTSLVVLLEQMFRNLASRKPPKVQAKMHQITQEEITAKLQDYMEQVRFVLFQAMYHRFKSRYEMVVHILALLEESKNKKLKIYQQDLCGPMWLYLTNLQDHELPEEIREQPYERSTENQGAVPN